jgi:hypothetical protein
MSTGMSDSDSGGSTSKNDLNSPLNEALKAGVTAMTPSALATVSKADSSSVATSPVSIASMIGRPSGRSSTYDDSAVMSKAASSVRTDASSRSASSRVEEGSREPPLMIVSLVVIS